jgi:hypothetical protein
VSEGQGFGRWRRTRRAEGTTGGPATRSSSWKLFALLALLVVIAATCTKLIGFVPGVGTPHDVVVNDTTGLAYVASAEFGLSVVNVSNAAAPVVLGATNPPFEGFQVAVSGSLAAVDAGVSGFDVVDVGNPSAPKTVGLLTATTLGGTVTGVELKGTVAYVLVSIPGNPGHTDLVTVNVAKPSAPAILGRVSLAAGQQVRVVGTLAYVAAGNAGLVIVNVATPSAPSIVGRVDTPGTAASVIVAGSYAYVADTTAVQVVNVATPSRPTIVRSLAASALGVTVAGNRLYTTDGGSFRIVDVTNPSAPTILSTSNSYGAQAVGLDGTVAVLASPNVTGSQGGLYLWDVSSPTAPTVRADINDAFGNMEVAVSGSLAVAAGGLHGMKVLSLSAPTAPKVTSTMSATALGGTVVGVAIAGPTAYALVSVGGNPGHTDVVVVSLAKPSAPAIAGRVSLSAGMTIKVAGSLVYVAAGSTGLQIVNVASPNAPIFVGKIDTPGTATDVAVSGGYAYVADTTAVQVVNVATPSRPTIVRTLATSATAVVVGGTKLYAVDGSQFKVIDVTSPTAPVLLSATSGYGSVQGVTVVGTTAFLATPAQLHSDRTGGLYVLDVTTPTNPVLQEQLSVPGMTRMLTTDQTYVYASDYSGILDVLDPNG